MLRKIEKQPRGNLDDARYSMCDPRSLPNFFLVRASMKLELINFWMFQLNYNVRVFIWKLFPNFGLKIVYKATVWQKTVWNCGKGASRDLKTLSPDRIHIKKCWDSTVFIIRCLQDRKSKKLKGKMLGVLV